MSQSSKDIFFLFKCSVVHSCSDHTYDSRKFRDGKIVKCGSTSKPLHATFNFVLKTEESS